MIRHASREQVSKGFVVNRIVTSPCYTNMVQCVVVCGEFWTKKSPDKSGLRSEGLEIQVKKLFVDVVSCLLF